MASSRLPGKNAKPILGKPMLAHLLARLKHATEVDVVCLATTEERADDRLEDIARQESAEVHRGSTGDVLSRVLGAARSVAADLIVTITGDCPLSDPHVIDTAIRRYRRGGFDYIANVLDDLTFPAGFDVQVFRADHLEEISRLTSDPQDREDVTRYFYQHPDRYRLLNLRAPRELHRPRYWLCVDYPEDFEVMSAIYEGLYPRNAVFGIHDVIEFLDARPDLVARNSGREGLFTCPQSGGRAVQETLSLRELTGQT